MEVTIYPNEQIALFLYLKSTVGWNMKASNNLLIIQQRNRDFETVLAVASSLEK